MRRRLTTDLVVKSTYSTMGQLMSTSNAGPTVRPLAGPIEVGTLYGPAPKELAPMKGFGPKILGGSKSPPKP